MIERILNFKNYTNEELVDFENEIIATKDARLMFLFLYFVSSENIDSISEKILKTGNIRYIHFLLRSFEIKNYSKFIEFILSNNNDASYLYNILFDVDYLDNSYRIKLIDKILSLGVKKYIMKAIYYYFIVLDLFDEYLFSKIKPLFKEELSFSLNKDNYKQVFDSILYRSIEDKFGFSKNCYTGRKDYIPTIIVCHSNSTYSSALNNFYDDKSEVSAHYVIRKDGHVKQVVSLDDSSWANGTSVRPESDVYYKFSSSSLINTVADNANYFTFSIEHESFDGSLTDSQFASTVKVMKEIIKYVKDKYDYDFEIDREHIIGHCEINPIVRTKCPGDKFPYDKIIEELKKV